MRYQLALSAAAALVGGTAAWTADFHEAYPDWEHGIRGHQHIPGADASSSAAIGNGTFKQLIDHKNPSLGTFDQFYYWSNEHWNGSGSPIVMFTPGEINVTGYQSYLSLNRTTGVLAQKLGAAGFVLEHRYWGVSSPFADLSTENLQYLTLENAILDLTYFANHVQLPWAPATPSTAKDVPWVMSGGSYSGALSAWTESVAPGTYWAYHSSSAPVEAISDYAAYFYPVQQGMAKNCSSDINAVIEHMDAILTSGDQGKITQLKTMFKLETVEHNDDFMAALENGPWLWQGNQFYTGYSPFFQFCDYVEHSYNISDSAPRPGAEGVGVDKALAGYAEWFTDVFLPDYCYDSFGYDDFKGTYNTACFNTYNASSPLFTDATLSNTYIRQWNWLLCNEPFGYWQDGAPTDRPTLVSRLVDAQYWIRQCDLFFPPGPHGETYGIAKGKTEAVTNHYTKGWHDRSSRRLIYANGGFDPWRESGVSADIRPGGPMQSTSQRPINIVPGGFHTSDLITKNGVANKGCQDVIDAEVAQLVDWVGEWKHGGHGGWQSWTG